MIILLVLKLGITMLIHNIDDIEFVTEFPCFWDTLYIKGTVVLSDPPMQKLAVSDPLRYP